jgi:hypothetical protein
MNLRLRDQRLPASNGVDALSSQCDVAKARKQPPQFYDCGELAALLQCSTDYGCLCLANAEHRRSMRAHAHAPQAVSKDRAPSSFVKARKRCHLVTAKDHGGAGCDAPAA